MFYIWLLLYVQLSVGSVGNSTIYVVSADTVDISLVQLEMSANEVSE